MTRANHDGKIPASVLREGERKRQAFANRLRPVGYWRDPDDLRTASWPDPHALVDPTWDQAERDRIVDYLRSGRTRFVHRGFSWCRFQCGVSDREMGDRDVTDGEYVWPEGLVHYVSTHAVRPPDAFIEHVRRRMAHPPTSLVRRVIARLRGKRPARP